MAELVVELIGALLELLPWPKSPRGQAIAWTLLSSFAVLVCISAALMLSAPLPLWLLAAVLVFGAVGFAACLTLAVRRPDARPAAFLGACAGLLALAAPWVAAALVAPAA
jgi:uncharacterized membrane protein